MASGGATSYYDDQSVPPYRYAYSYGYSRPSPSSSSSSATSFHMSLFLATASLLGAASLYSRCESAVESLFDQLRVVVVLSPLLLLLAAQYWSAASGRRWSSLSSLLVAPLVAGEQRPWYDVQQRDSGAGAASSPWGVALALALVLLLISYQSCFQDWWFPLVSRR